MERNKNNKAATFALMLDFKANYISPFQKILHNNLRNDPVAKLVRSDPLIKCVGEYYFNKRISDEGNTQIRDRMRAMAKFVLQLDCSYLIRQIWPDMWSRVKEAVSKIFAKCYRLELGSILKTAAEYFPKSSFSVGEEGDISTS